MIPNTLVGNATTVAPELMRHALADQIHQSLKPFDIHPVDSSEDPPATPISGLRRGLIAPEEEGVKIVTLLNVDGVLYWSGGAPSPSGGRRMQRAGLLSLFGGEPITTVKLQSLGVNEIAQRLEEMDHNFTPQGPAKLRRIQNGAMLPDEVQPAANGKILLFVHGTFSNNNNLIAEIDQIPEGQKFLKHVERFSGCCPKFLRQTFHEFASHSIGSSEWARAYYQHLRDDEKSPTMPRFALSPTNGFVSSFDAGRTVSPTASPCTCSPCAAGALSSVLLWRQPPVLGGNQLSVSKNFLENNA